MGLALDESENSGDHLTTSNDIAILLDSDIKKYVDNGVPLTIDYQETKYGAGFYIDNGSRC